MTEIVIALLTLTVLEVVLGVDNIIFISILSAKLRKDQQKRARRIGLLAAMGMRILLLLGISWIVSLTQPLFTIGRAFSGRDLILIGGGLFLLGKATYEIHDKLEGADDHGQARVAASFASVIFQVMLLDIVFSLDSVITAVGMADDVRVMIAAVVLAVLVMMFAAEPISRFVETHPTIKILALSFLLLIGVSLIADGFGTHIEKGYIYFAMGFSVFVEMINIRIRKKGKPVQLHQAYSLAFLLFLAPAVLTAQSSSYVPQRVYDTDHKRFVDFESMLADLVKADVVFVGEQHDDPNTHRLELAVLEGLARRRGGVIVSLEMFERDAQEPLEHFMMGHATEEEFLKVSRPWPRYATDYKPLVEFAISKDWHVVAANVPRPLASEVSKSGFAALESKSEDERKLFARERQCPTDDDYFKRFGQAMNEHPGAPASSDAAKREMTERFYLSQCLKDETMAESIAQAHAAASTGGRRPLVVHFNGAFHSDFGLGTAARTKRRLSGKRIVVLSVLPVSDLDKVSPDGDERKRADYLVCTIGK